jgi:hypothetical protein
MTDDVQTLVAEVERAVTVEPVLDRVIGRARRDRRRRRTARLVAALGIVALVGAGVVVAQRSDPARAPVDTVPPSPVTPHVELVTGPFGVDGRLDLIIAVGEGERLAFGATNQLGPTQVVRWTGGSWGEPTVLGTGAGYVIDAAFDGSTIVALTDPPSTRAWWSVDTRQWASEALPEASYARVVEAVPGGGFVAGGATDDDIAAWSSDDGHSWRLDPLGGVPYEVRGLAATDEVVVAVGLQGTNGAAWRRPIGATEWVGGPDPSFGHGAIVQDVATTENGFVAAGAIPNRYAVWQSDDGATWTEVETSGLPTEPTEGGVQTLEATPFGLIAVTSVDEAFLSADGRTWRPLYSFIAVSRVSGSYVEVREGDATVVVVGDNVEDLS